MHIVKSFLSLTLLSLFLSAHVFGQTAASTNMEKEIVSPWLVAVEGESKTRLLLIEGVAQKDPNTFMLDAKYGFTETSQSGVKAEIVQTPQDRKLTVVTQAASIILATQSADGNFSGTFTSNKGVVKGVKITKLSVADMQKAQADSKAIRQGAIVKPADDVPASLAVFSGKWTGMYANYGLGQRWIWVFNVKANGDVDFSYESSDAPKTRRSSTIRDGAFEWPCGQGKCVVSKRGDGTFMMNYGGTDGTNYIFLERAQ